VVRGNGTFGGTAKDIGFFKGGEPSQVNQRRRGVSIRIKGSEKGSCFSANLQRIQVEPKGARQIEGKWRVLRKKATRRKRRAECCARIKRDRALSVSAKLEAGRKKKKVEKGQKEGK